MKIFSVAICLIVALPVMAFSQSVVNRKHVSFSKEMISDVLYKKLTNTNFNSEGIICDVVVLNNDVLVKEIQIDGDVDQIKFKGKNACFLSEKAIFAYGVNKYIEFVKIQSGRKNYKTIVAVIERNGYQKKVLTTKKILFKK